MSTKTSVHQKAAYTSVRVANNVLEQVALGSKELLAGALLAVKGSLLAYCRPRVRELNYKFAKGCLKHSIKWYTIIGASLAATWPVSLPVLLFSPGWIVNMLLLVPLWAVSDATSEASEDIMIMFTEGMYTRDATLAKAIEQANNNNELKAAKHRSIVDRMKNSYYLTSWSIMAWGVSIIPGVGTVAGPAMEWGLVSRSLGWSISKQYMSRCLEWKQSKQLSFIQENIFRVIGFSAVFVLIGSIPIVGCFFISMGHCAAAHLFDEETIEEGRKKFGTSHGNTKVATGTESVESEHRDGRKAL
eukprot:CFRG2394T1